MIAIVAVTDDWGIGKDGKLLVRNRADMKLFRLLTLDNTVICGRKTFESFPNGALDRRRNIVITSDESFSAPNVDRASSTIDALRMASESNDLACVIGGESIYRQMLPFCSLAFVTKNHVSVPFDTAFPNLDADDRWELVEEVQMGETADGIAFSVCIYERK